MKLVLYPTALVLVLALSFQTSDAALNKVICYYESWASGSFTPEDIDVSICNIINYSFVGINADGSIKGGTDPLIKRLTALKSKNPNLKVLLSVGGWSEGGKTFSDVANDATKRANMAQSALNLIKTQNLDGLDVDWEYPGSRGGKASDKQAYVQMLQALKTAFGSKYLVTVAVSSSPNGGLYDIPAISKTVDAINLMTYDFIEGGSTTGHNSPLYGGDSCDASTQAWLKAGADANKLILGLAFYGHSFKLASAADHGVGARSSGAGSGGGTVDYKNICKLTGYTTAFDDKAKNPYKYSSTDWIGYDDAQSIGLKVQYAKSKNLGGVMMWAVDSDDKGTCGEKLPLLNAIKKNL